MIRSQIPQLNPKMWLGLSNLDSSILGNICVFPV